MGSTRPGTQLAANQAEGDVNEERPEYLSYVLRLWRETEDPEDRGLEAAVWRASLEWPQADKRRGFASLTDLFTSLESETRSGGPKPLEEERR